MATVNHRSPSPTSFKGDNTYEFPPKNHLCAWAAVVRGEPELISQSPLSSSSSFSTVSAPETPETPAPAPTSDFFASSEEGAPVMGADSWPDLAESAKASPKLAVDSPSKSVFRSISPPFLCMM